MSTSLVRFSFLVSEEGLADCRELINIYGVVSKQFYQLVGLLNMFLEQFFYSLNVTYSSLSKAAKQASIVILCSKLDFCYSCRPVS